LGTNDTNSSGGSVAGVSSEARPRSDYIGQPSNAAGAELKGSAGTSHGLPDSPRPVARGSLCGLIERVVYHNPQNGYFVVRVKVDGQRDLSTVVGFSAQIGEGERIEAHGEWVKNDKYGEQFKAKDVKRATPQDGAGLAKYIAAALDGVGPGLAARLVEKFGASLPEIIEQQPERLREVEGVGKKRIAAIREAWTAKAEEGKSLAWLCGIGLSVKQARAVVQMYGQRARAAIEANPYRLADDFSGIGFIKADAMARQVGIKEDSDLRVDAAVLYCVSQSVDSGSCGVNADDAARQALRILKFPENDDSVECIRLAIKRLASQDRVIVDWSASDVCLFPRWLYGVERQVAGMLLRLRDEPTALKIEGVDELVERVEKGMEITLDERQRQAVRDALSGNVTVVTGGPGTGKTTLTKAIVRAFARVKITEQGYYGPMERHCRIIVCAPTGKAAKRASEAIGVEAVTIHRALNWGAGGPGFDSAYPLKTDVLIVDEVSMVDVPLMHALLAAVPRGARVVFVGDQDQLPSVGPGRVLADLIVSQAIAVVKLEVVFRQAAESRIIVSSHAVKAANVLQVFHRSTSEEAHYLCHAHQSERIRVKRDRALES